MVLCFKQPFVLLLDQGMSRTQKTVVLKAYSSDLALHLHKVGGHVRDR